VTTCRSNRIMYFAQRFRIGRWCIAFAGPPEKPNGKIEVLDVQKDSVLIAWKPPGDTGGKPLT